MCMEDVILDREKSGRTSQVSITGPAAVQIATADERRTALTVSSDGTATVFLAPEGIAPANLFGYVLNAQEPHATLRLDDWGMLLRGAWRAFVNAGTVLVFVADVRLERT